MAERKIKGTFCERKGQIKRKSQCGKGSFRYSPSGDAWILFCCQKQHWHPGQVYSRIVGKKRKRARGKCDRGWMRTHKVLSPVAKNTRCKRGEVRITK